MVGDVALHRRLPHGGAVDAQKAADCAVGQHQRIGQPQKAHIHGFIDLVDQKGKGEFLFRRDLHPVLNHAADGAPQKLRHGKERIHGGGQAGHSAEKGHQQRRIALRHTVGYGHVGKEVPQAALLLHIVRRLPDVLPPEPEAVVLFLHAPLLVEADTALHHCRRHGKAALEHQQPRHAEPLKQHRRQRHHHYLQNGIEGSGHGIALLFHALRDQLGIDAVVGQLIKGAETGQNQRHRQIAHIGKLEKQQIDAHQRVDHTVGQVARHQKGLARQAVHAGREKQRQHKARHKLDGNDEGRGQRAARLVKDQKGQGKAAGDTAHSPQCRRHCHQRKIFRPKCLLHISHLAFIVAWR